MNSIDLKEPRRICQQLALRNEKWDNIDRNNGGNHMICNECYVAENRATPLLHPKECLENHTQYICGSCGRCICIEQTEKGLQRWQFPFKSLEIAKLYLRTADFTMKQCCGIYEIQNSNGRFSYKIFTDKNTMLAYLKKNKDKSCISGNPLFSTSDYREFPNTEIRKLTAEEVRKYLSQQ
ncbi:hypothetical protein ACVRXF_09995 [Streptococcus orisasini]